MATQPESQRTPAKVTASQAYCRCAAVDGAVVVVVQSADTVVCISCDSASAARERTVELAGVAREPDLVQRKVAVVSHVEMSDRLLQLRRYEPETDPCLAAPERDSYIVESSAHSLPDDRAWACHSCDIGCTMMPAYSHYPVLFSVVVILA